MFKYFTSSLIATILGLAGSAGIGYLYSGTLAGALQALFIAAVLAVLEISLSFDNAIVNAVVLKEMTPLWRRRFLTWGMLIAVFGMRLVFPLVIVAVVGSVGPWEALVMAAMEPDRYAAMMLQAHVSVSAFGGTFLMMVAIKYFLDETKEVHWLQIIEKPLVKLGKLEAIEVGLVLIMLVAIGRALPLEQFKEFFLSGIAGLLTFLAVDGLGAWLESEEQGQAKDLHKASAGLFIYLEVLDASFSFDGVVGAFAITSNLFLIMLGLSIGAFFVRSLTLMFVDKGTLAEFVYLEHGAFYAIFALASLMLLGPFFHIPEWITGLIGMVFIVASFVASVRHNRSQTQSV